MIHGELVPVALIWFIAVPFRKSPREHAALLVWWLLPYLVFSLAVTKMPGYTAIAAPAICIIIGMAIERWSSIDLPKAIRIPALIGAAGLVLLPLRFSLDRTRPWAATSPRYTIPPELVHGSPHMVVTNCPIPIEVMFHTPVAAAYGGDLDPAQREVLRRQGYFLVGFQDL